MAWNEPENDDRKKDAWGSGPRDSKDQGPPDLDELLRSLNRRFSRLFGRRGGGSAGTNGGLPRGLIVGGLVIAGVIYAATGFYTVDEQERGVVLRFGRALEEVVLPGLHWNPPLMDNVTLINTTRVYTQDIAGTMLTVDDNIIDLAMSVQYLITDARSYFLEVRDPEASLLQAAESAIRHVVGSTEMTVALTEGRAQMAQEVHDRLQTYLDDYGTGITVSQVNIERSQPPAPVRAAFDDVIKADEDNRSIQNQARAYASQVVPEARGFARRTIEEANAYREEVVARAQGEAERFEQLFAEYEKAPAVLRTRLYIDALESVLSNSSKVLVDVEGGNNMLYLPLDQLMQRSQPSATGGRTTVTPLTNSDIQSIADQVLRNLEARQASSSRGTGR